MIFKSQLSLLLICSIIVLISMAFLSSQSLAKDDDRNRAHFHGWIVSKPEGFLGTWIIGGRQVTTGPQTEFDQEEGPLIVGACAKVELRNNGVHEIDTESPHDCR